MSNDPPKEDQAPGVPPVSVFSGPIAELVGHRLLSPPNRPGLLATLAGYEVIRVLGGGGMGVVLLARNTASGRDVALKMVRPELASNPQVAHRFVREAGHLQKLKHPHVVPVLEVSDRAEGPYFVMPYYERGSLAQVIKPGRGMDSPVILDIAIQVAQGLQFAHRRGIIHRDLKPANILLGANGQTCLADFGLARTMFNDTIVDVEHDQLEGTAPYMSPAVAAGNAEDTRCDIYAFGALLYEMLTGDPPYAGQGTADIRRQIVAGPPKAIRARNPEADAGLAAVAEGAMARELRNRYADMTDVVADLERIKQGRTPAGPHGLVRRVRRASAGVWILAGVVLAALVWALWPMERAKTIHPVTQTFAPPLTPPTIAKQPEKPVAPPRWTPPVIIGAAGVSGAVDGTGSQARFSSPSAIAVDSAGVIYVADMGNHTIRKILPSGEVRTLAGLAGKPGMLDGQGVQARFSAPTGIAVDGAGNIYVAEFVNDTVRKITPDGAVTLLAGSPGNPGWKDEKGDNAHFRNPWSIAVDSRGNVFVADKDNFVIRQIAPDGRVTTLAGQPGVPGFSDGAGSIARFRDPHGIAVDGSGNIYVADTANQAIRKITSLGVVTTIAQGLSNPESVAVDSAGAVYVADAQGIHKISGSRSDLVPEVSLGADSSGPLAHADAIAVSPTGTLYLADTLHNVICSPSVR